MRAGKIVGDMIQGQLLPHAVLTLAERANPSPDRGDMLADAQVDALNEGGVDGPTVHGQHLLNSRPRAEDHPRAHPHQAPPAYRLDHLRIEEPGQGYPARLGGWPWGLAARWLDPVAIVRQQGCRVLFEAIGQESGHTTRPKYSEGVIRCQSGLREWFRAAQRGVKSLKNQLYGFVSLACVLEVMGPNSV